MPSKLFSRHFEFGHYYHLRHSVKSNLTLFQTDADYQNFNLLLSYYLRFPDATPLSWVKRLTPSTVIKKRNNSSLGNSPATLFCFLLLPDHFHLVLRENVGAFRPGISNLMRRLSIGYAMYYNKTHSNTGTIYHGKYKMVAILQDQLSSLVNSLHHHEGVNDTYLASPIHSSRSDYVNTSRSWLTITPTTTDIAISSSLLLD